MCRPLLLYDPVPHRHDDVIRRSPSEESRRTISLLQPKCNKFLLKCCNAPIGEVIRLEGRATDAIFIALGLADIREGSSAGLNKAIHRAPCAAISTLPIGTTSIWRPTLRRPPSCGPCLTAPGDAFSFMPSWCSPTDPPYENDPLPKQGVVSQRMDHWGHNAWPMVQLVAIPMVGEFCDCPPLEPRKVASPKLKMPPSVATIQ